MSIHGALFLWGIVFFEKFDANYAFLWVVMGDVGRMYCAYSVNTILDQSKKGWQMGKQET